MVTTPSHQGNCSLGLARSLAKMNKINEFLLKFWQGKIRLVWMFWAWGVLASILMTGLSISFDVMSNNSQFWLLFLYLIYISYRVFWLVAFWRSASNWSVRHTGDIFTDWGLISKLWLVLAVIISTIKYFYN